MSGVSDFSVGPVVYTIVSEVPSTRLRAKTIVLARNAYNIINLAFVNVISYRQFNQDAWNWGPKACFFWAGINLIMNTYLYFRLRELLISFSFISLIRLELTVLDSSAETKGRTYAELDILFANKISARKFAKTKIGHLTEGTEAAQKEQVAHIIHEQPREKEVGEV